jgi:hypothetical protein
MWERVLRNLVKKMLMIPTPAYLVLLLATDLFFHPNWLQMLLELKSFVPTGSV